MGDFFLDDVYAAATGVVGAKCRSWEDENAHFEGNRG